MKMRGQTVEHLMNFDWHSIRAIRGSQREGFEELVAQLAESAAPATAHFKRVGSPDAGVECYCVLEDGSEWGWQAKFFTSALTNSQWRQLDKSVRTALDKHPNLVSYFVAIPWDNPEPRIEGQTSAKDRWEERVSKWKGWAQEIGMEVEFVWWGSSKLTNLLVQEKRVGTVFFWFHEQYFSRKWYKGRLDEAVKSAGHRYTPEVHIDLPITLDIDMFGRSDSAFSRVKALGRDIRTAFKKISSSRIGEDSQLEIPELNELLRSRDAILSDFSDLQPSPSGGFSLAGIAKKVEAAAQGPTYTLAESLNTLANEYDSKPDNTGERNPFRDLFYRVHRLATILGVIRDEIIEADQLVNSRVMILKGKAGTGKTHLLCDVARRRQEDGAPTVLLMGQRFTDLSNPWTQALQLLDMGHAKAEQFIGALECSAQVANRRALLIIDALNEGSGPEIWAPNLSAFLSQVANSPWIDVILSVRSSYEQDVIPNDVRDEAIHKTHKGFDGHEYEALRTFSNSYRIDFPSTPILQPEFANPLLLKMTCEGLAAKGERRLPRGFRGVTAIFDLRWTQ